MYKISYTCLKIHTSFTKLHFYFVSIYLLFALELNIKIQADRCQVHFDKLQTYDI